MISGSNSSCWMLAGTFQYGQKITASSSECKKGSFGPGPAPLLFSSRVRDVALQRFFLRKPAIEILAGSRQSPDGWDRRDAAAIVES